MAETPNKQIARSFMNALSTGDVEAMSGIISKDIEALTTGTSVLSTNRNYDAVLEAVAGLKQATKNGIAVEIISLTEEGDRVVCEWKGSSEILTGTPYNNEYVFIFRIADGKVHRMTEYMDTKLADEVMGPMLGG